MAKTHSLPFYRPLYRWPEASILLLSFTLRVSKENHKVKQICVQAYTSSQCQPSQLILKPAHRSFCFNLLLPAYAYSFSCKPPCLSFLCCLTECHFFCCLSLSMQAYGRTYGGPRIEQYYQI